jgi:hypothetical protein
MVLFAQQAMRTVRLGDAVDILRQDVNLVISKRRAVSPPSLPLTLRSLPEFSTRVRHRADSDSSNDLIWQALQRKGLELRLGRLSMSTWGCDMRWWTGPCPRLIRD